MSKPTKIRIALILLQLTCMAISSIIIIIYYNPWIGRIIDEAERSGNTGRTLADQIRRTDNEELVIFLMSVSTFFVSFIGMIGVLRSHEHNNCLLNFYTSTLILFLFVLFVAICGTIWQIFGKLHRPTMQNKLQQQQQQNTVQFDLNNNNNDLSAKVINEKELIDLEQELNNKSTNQNNNTPTTTTTSNTSSAVSRVTWWYIGKSLILIIFATTIYTTSLKLTRKLESCDDRYLSANECNGDDDLNSENGVLSHTTTTMFPFTNSLTNTSRYPYNFTTNYTGNITDIYSNGGGNMIGSSKSSLGSQFRTIL